MDLDSIARYLYTPIVRPSCRFASNSLHRAQGYPRDDAISDAGSVIPMRLVLQRVTQIVCNTCTKNMRSHPNQR